MNNRLKWFQNISNMLYRLFSLLLLHNAAICQNWEKRRMAKRQNCHISVEVIHNNQRFFAVIRNISPYGARLDFIEGRIQAGDRIALQFPLHYLEPPVETRARVAWADYGSAGIEFELK